MEKLIYFFYIFFQGALIFQGIFFLSIYFFSRRKDVLWYSFYLLTAALYFFINATDTFFGINEDFVFNSTWYSVVNIPIIILENYFYLLFIKCFFFNIIESVQVKKVVNIAMYTIPFLFLVFVIARFLRINTQVIFYVVKMLSVIPAIFIVITVLKFKPPFARLVSNGLIFTIFGTTLTLLMILLGHNGFHSLITDFYPLIFIRFGILADMFFFQLALLKKWQSQEQLLVVQKLASEMAIRKVRDNISKELHDDIGSTLSGINMYSHLAEEQADKGFLKQYNQSLEKIRLASGEMIHKLKDMVWSIQPGHFELTELVDKINEHAQFMCGAKNMKLIFTAAIEDDIEIETEWRHQVFMIAKEIINNAVKYSQSQTLQIKIENLKEKFILQIEDMGIGFESDKILQGNGLNNIKERSKEIEADLQINSLPGKGTSVDLKTNIPQLGIAKKKSK